ncbi:MAG: acyltransferase, partial [Shewanella sp.]
MGTLFSQLKGCIAFLGYVVNTLFWVAPIVLGSLIKLIPLPVLRTAT